uniref:F-box domain-containing protein n=1 Tax=Coccolithus braarudii TaxID=221442 RepID=A0A7S0L949_9EUKA|mmetsp:Transcript_24910/g.53766  ORF Transcript_24910/g.53766 Transcript_24910/m.53766 type:complete len:262 (+) Transcript_24910:46-831(+)
MRLPAITIDVLPTDAVLHVLSHASFASLLALRVTCHGLREMACATLSSTQWKTGMQMCRIPAKVAICPSTFAIAAAWDLLIEASETKPCMERLAAGFLTALQTSDIRTAEVLLHLGLVSARQPVHSADLRRWAFPLHYAHSDAMVALLCSYGTQVDARSDDGSTPLMEAAYAGEVAVVRALCEHGANVHLRNGGLSSIALHQAENSDLRSAFLRTTTPPEASLWRFIPSDTGGAAAAKWWPVPNGAACARVLLGYGAIRML